MNMICDICGVPQNKKVFGHGFDLCEDCEKLARAAPELAREKLLSCINVMKDRKGTDEADERAFSLAYLSAYQLLTGFSLRLTGDEVDQFNPIELEGREGK